MSLFGGPLIPLFLISKAEWVALFELGRGIHVMYFP